MREELTSAGFSELTTPEQVDRLLDVAPGAVRREGAVLDRPRFDRVVAALRQVHGAVIQS
jgi:hypothetical protein